MRVLLLSAYDADSHRAWHRQLTDGLADWQWTVLTLPPRYFSWRVRGNSLSWAFGARDTLARPYDLVLATSMTDLSALRGFVPALARIPTAVYFHENQFAYPDSARAFASVEPRILNLYTALAADRVLFNSAFNRDSFLAGCRALLKKLPDQVPPGLIARLEACSAVLPVPLDDALFDARAGAGRHVDWRDGGRRSLRLVWSARWEYDKGPRRLLAIVQQLERSGIDYRLCLLGQRFRGTPAEFDEIGRRFAHRLVQFGYTPQRADYLAWLRSADLVLSTAEHEFQGLAVLEAVACGCVPLLPSRLVYPELVDADWLYPDEADIEQEARGAVERIHALAPACIAGDVAAPSVGCFAWRVLRSRYRDCLQAVAAGDTPA